MIAAAAFLGFLAVILGAFAAHGLQGTLSEYALGIFHTAAQYQMIHALALFSLSLYLDLKGKIKILEIAGYAFIAGIFIFCGSLYALAFTGIKILGAITPIGGLLFMLGWLLIAWHFMRAKKTV